MLLRPSCGLPTAFLRPSCGLPTAFLDLPEAFLEGPRKAPRSRSWNRSRNRSWKPLWKPPWKPLWKAPRKTSGRPLEGRWNASRIPPGGFFSVFPCFFPRILDHPWKTSGSPLEAPLEGLWKAVGRSLEGRRKVSEQNYSSDLFFDLDFNIYI